MGVDVDDIEKICREMTLEEEIEKLDIHPETKERLLKKCRQKDEQIKDYDEWLGNCHKHIDRLEGGLIELSILFAKHCKGD